MIFILYVENQEISKNFYKELLGIEPLLDVIGMTEFKLAEVILGIMPEEGIVKVLEGKIQHPKNASGIPRNEIYLYVDNPDVYYDKLVKVGEIGISRTAVRSWGDYVSYGLDPDRHSIAFAKKAGS